MDTDWQALAFQLMAACMSEKRRADDAEAMLKEAQRVKEYGYYDGEKLVPLGAGWTEEAALSRLEKVARKKQTVAAGKGLRGSGMCHPLPNPPAT